MVSRSSNYQDMVLNHVRKEGIPVTVFLISGYQLKGVIKAFDNYVILMDSDGKQQMIYKHAISTVAPSRTVRLLHCDKPCEKPCEKTGEQPSEPVSEEK